MISLVHMSAILIWISRGLLFPKRPRQFNVVIFCSYYNCSGCPAIPSKLTISPHLNTWTLEDAHVSLSTCSRFIGTNRSNLYCNSILIGANSRCSRWYYSVIRFSYAILQQYNQPPSQYYHSCLLLIHMWTTRCSVTLLIFDSVLALVLYTT